MAVGCAHCARGLLTTRLACITPKGARARHITAPCHLWQAAQPQRGRRQQTCRAKRVEFEGVANKDLPAELQGLRLNDDGVLVDEKNGKVINEYGATRFDVAVRAIRGEFDPPAHVENTDRNEGLILGALFSFPTDYVFQVVARTAEVSASFPDEVAATIARVCRTEPDKCHISVKERLHGKFVSVKVKAPVLTPDDVQRTYSELRTSHRVVMNF